MWCDSDCNDRDVEAWWRMMVDAAPARQAAARRPARGKKGFSALGTGALPPRCHHSPPRRPPSVISPPTSTLPPSSLSMAVKQSILTCVAALAPSPLRTMTIGVVFAGFHGNARPRSQNCPGHNQLSPTDHEGLCSFRRFVGRARSRVAAVCRSRKDRIWDFRGVHTVLSATLTHPSVNAGELFV